jgi:hypothetical protein
VPWPVSEFVKIIVAIYVLGARLFALALIVNVTVVPLVDAAPEVAEGVSQLGKPDIAKLMSRSEFGFPDRCLNW